MLKVILTKGLPASGKTTFAKELLAKEPGKWKRINKDDLRAMLDGGKWSKENEKYVLDVRDFLIATALIQDYNVIVDDCNLAPKHEIRIKQLVESHNGAVLPKPKAVEFEIKDFTDVPLEECIKRDQKRPNYVGEKVIRQMYNQFLRPKPIEPEFNPKLPSAIICDLDGTLALFGDANPYDRDFSRDKVNPIVLDILKRYKKDTEILLVSGRSDAFEKETLDWLNKNKVPFNWLIMRKEGDNRHDNIVKKEIYDTSIEGLYNVKFVIDDRKKIKEMWVSMGLFVFDVNQLDIDF